MKAPIGQLIKSTNTKITASQAYSLTKKNKKQKTKNTF